jgi:hypothetical protein
MCRFILDAVADLRDTLRAAGSDLIVRIGKPEEVRMQLPLQLPLHHGACVECTFTSAIGDASLWGSCLWPVCLKCLLALS